MKVQVKVVETSLATHQPIPVLKDIACDDWGLVVSADKSAVHLEVVKDKKVIAFFPHGSWYSVQTVEDKDGIN